MDIKLKQHGGEWEEIEVGFPHNLQNGYEFLFFRREKKEGNVSKPKVPDVMIGDAIETMKTRDHHLPNYIVTDDKGFNVFYAVNQEGTVLELEKGDLLTIYRRGQVYWKRENTK